MPDRPDIDIDHLATLARLALTPEEKARFAAQLAQVVGHFQQLAQVDVTGVEPTAHAHPVEDVWDEDVARPGLPPDEALRPAPARQDGQFLVPRVVD
jgi:aspartyl-tRNA(Asn)/glutamyl-tRNA(Gln) amidotransferase subunit C